MFNTSSGIEKINGFRKAIVPKLNKSSMNRMHGMVHLNDGRLDRLYGTKNMQQLRWWR